jgi:hypothetical protein
VSWPVRRPAQMVATHELRAALERSLSHHFGTQRRVVELERRPSAYSTSFAIEELDVRLDDGASLRLLFKDLSQQGMLGSARRIKPAFLYDPLREIETYRAILGPNRLSTPTFYGAYIDHPTGRYGLFLEKVPGLELYQVGDLATWQRVARWLAAMHARFAGETERFARAARLLRYDAEFYRLWIRRARAAWDRFGSSQSRGVRLGMERLTRNYEQVVEHLTALPITFIHGEFYASNVLVQETAGEELRVCPVDWEMAAVGPGLIDLAALSAGGWTADEKTTLALTYHAALTPRDEWSPEPEAFLVALDHCHLHLAVQWLGWASEWSPPPEHAQDWLAEALSLAGKLGL